MSRMVHPIEAESYAILRSRLDTSGLPPLTRRVVERVIHASADLDYATDLVCDETALRAGVAALRAGAPIVADVRMVAAGITARPVVCRLGAPGATPQRAEAADGTRLTRTAAAIHQAYADVGRGAVWVVGCAPTALVEICRLGAAPALVIGLPVGFVGAAEAKATLRASGLPALSNVTAKGGSAVAAAAVNALIYALESPDAESPDPAETPAATESPAAARPITERETA